MILCNIELNLVWDLLRPVSRPAWCPCDWCQGSVSALLLHVMQSSHLPSSTTGVLNMGHTTTVSQRKCNWICFARPSNARSAHTDPSVTLDIHFCITFFPSALTVLCNNVPLDTSRLARTSTHFHRQ